MRARLHAAGRARSSAGRMSGRALLDLWAGITRRRSRGRDRGRAGHREDAAGRGAAGARTRAGRGGARRRAPSRRRPRWPTAQWSTRCAGGCARTTTLAGGGLGGARSRRRRACSESSVPNRRHRSTDRPPRRASSTASGRRSPPPRLGRYRACCSSMTCSGPMTRRSACSPTGCGGSRAAGCSWSSRGGRRSSIRCAGSRRTRARRTASSVCAWTRSASCCAQLGRPSTRG